MLNPYRVASRWRYAKQNLRLSGSERLVFTDIVFGMYKQTYGKFGDFNLSSPRDLLEFEVWDLSVDDLGTPRAFSCYKKTPFGLKSSAGGSDGSSTGVMLFLDNVKSKLHVPGIYAEVSHAMEAIAIKTGAPVVCNSLVAKILNKEIVPDRDQIHYVRSISGIGLTRKVLIGNPLGVPTTSMSNPVCGLAASLQGKQEKVSHITDFYAHIACFL